MLVSRTLLSSVADSYEVNKHTWHLFDICIKLYQKIFQRQIVRQFNFHICWNCWLCTNTCGCPELDVLSLYQIVLPNITVPDLWNCHVSDLLLDVYTVSILQPLVPWRVTARLNISASWITVYRYLNTTKKRKISYFFCLNVNNLQQMSFFLLYIILYVIILQNYNNRLKNLDRKGAKMQITEII